MKERVFTYIVILLFFATALIPVVVGKTVHNESIFSNFKSYSKNANADSYDMVIIAPSSYESSLSSFISHKNDLGIKTIFVSLNEIYSGTYFDTVGRDDPEKIKYFIKDAIESWQIIYVLFVGSFNQVPIRYCYNNDEYNDKEPKFVSELYYADIYDENDDFSTWDSDEDGIFGEWDGNIAEDKPIDLTPDVCLGRLACTDSSEVSIVTSKIMNYANRPANPSWFKRIVVCGGDTYDEFEGYEGEIYNQEAIDAMPGFTAIKLWGSNGKLKNGWSIYREINKGCGFWYLSGHGNEELWATYDSDGNSIGKFTSLHSLFLRNKEKLPVCLVGGCHNSKFAIPSFVKFNFVWNPFKWTKECWSWRLVSKPNGGSIATLGPTGLSWYSAEFDGGGTNWLNVQFFKEYSTGTKAIGKIWKDALTKYIDNFPIDWETPSGDNHSLNAKTIQEWTLLGDPSLTIGGNPNSDKQEIL